MRNGNTPSENDARKKLQEFAIIAAKQTRKGVHSASELNSKCKCTYNWAVSHFKSSVVKQKAGATFGNFVQRLQSYIVIHLICKIKKNGLSTRKIAEMTGYSIATVSRANEDKINIRDIEIFSAYYKEATEDFKQKYKELYIALKNIIKDIISSSSSYTLYNNTDVTVDENKLQNDLKTIENNSREIDFVEKRLEMFFSKKYTWPEYTENLQKVVNMRPTMSDYQHRYLQRDYSYYRNNLKAV